MAQRKKYSNIKWLRWDVSVNCLICILLRYSIDRHTDLDRFFTINPEDGFIKTTKPLDREETAWLNISVFAAEIRKYSLRVLIPLDQILFFQTLYILENDRQLRQNTFFHLKYIFQSLTFIFSHLSRKTYKQIEMFSFSLAELGTDLASELMALD